MLDTHLNSPAVRIIYMEAFDGLISIVFVENRPESRLPFGFRCDITSSHDALEMTVSSGYKRIVVLSMTCTTLALILHGRLFMRENSSQHLLNPPCFLSATMSAAYPRYTYIISRYRLRPTSSYPCLAPSIGLHANISPDLLTPSSHSSLEPLQPVSVSVEKRGRKDGVEI